jgi:hypothetical protein
MIVQSMVLNMSQLSLWWLDSSQFRDGGVNDYRLGSDLSTHFGVTFPGAQAAKAFDRRDRRVNTKAQSKT